VISAYLNTVNRTDRKPIKSEYVDWFMRWAFPVCVALLLVLVTGCLGLGEGEVKEVEIEVREDLELNVYNTTIVKTGEGWETKHGENVSDECVRELKKHILEDSVGTECLKPEAVKKAEEREEKREQRLANLETRIDEKSERLENLFKELEEAREKNQTERVDKIQRDFDEVNQTLGNLTAEYSEIPPGMICEYPGNRVYVVNFTYTNFTTVTVRSSEELACDDQDYSWRVAEGGNIIDEGKVTNPDRVTYLVERIR